MVVEITNLTDAPGLRSREVRIFNTRLLPGKSMRIQAQFVDSKMRAIEEAGHISIGAVPTWYSDHKTKKVLTADEVVASRKRAVSHAKAKADANEKFLSKGSKPEKAAPAPEPSPPPTEEKEAKKVELSDAVDITDETKTEQKSGKRSKRR